MTAYFAAKPALRPAMSASHQALVAPIEAFLLCPTPAGWIDAAAQNIELLLVDHANCEKKAASTAMNLMYRYVEKPELIMALSKLAREELRHFEQVLALMQARRIAYPQINSARYAGELRKSVRTHEPAKLIDVLIVSAIVEARSCERFAVLVPVLEEKDPELAAFYASLLKSESRHFRVYLDYARQYSDEPIDDRIAHFLAEDQRLVESVDTDFRFHSGVPQ